MKTQEAVLDLQGVNYTLQKSPETGEFFVIPPTTGGMGLFQQLSQKHNYTNLSIKDTIKTIANMAKITDSIINSGLAKDVEELIKRYKVDLSLRKDSKITNKDKAIRFLEEALYYLKQEDPEESKEETKSMYEDLPF